MREKIYCDKCRLEIDEDSDFCPRCGTLFSKGVKCPNHPSTDAEYVCVICNEPYCKKCGAIVSRVFLCGQHDFYEVYEGMARVYGSSDFAQVNYIKGCLEQETLHPFIYSRKASPMHLGGSDYSLFRASGDWHIINEIKLMIPCSEVLAAEKIIEELDLSES
jgi:RNA polymerase subunit RPABC4/transcription elongation factor Spt4